MHAVARTNHTASLPRLAAHGSRVSSTARVVMTLGAAVAVALLIGWVVAATLGLGAEGHLGIGPDRPPVLGNALRP
jgi:hypothetical protein